MKCKYEGLEVRISQSRPLQDSTLEVRSVAVWLQWLTQNVGLDLQRNEPREKPRHSHIPAMVIQVGVCRPFSTVKGKGPEVTHARPASHEL